VFAHTKRIPPRVFTRTRVRLSGLLLVFLSASDAVGARARVAPSPLGCLLRSVFTLQNLVPSTNTQSACSVHNMPETILPASGAGWDVSVGDLEERARQLARLIEEYRFLAQCHVTDYYTENLWQTLPADWRTTLESLSVADALHLISLSKDPTGNR